MREIKFRAWDKNERKMIKPPVELKQLLRQVSDRTVKRRGCEAHQGGSGCSILRGFENGSRTDTRRDTQGNLRGRPFDPLQQASARTEAAVDGDGSYRTGEAGEHREAGAKGCLDMNILAIDPGCTESAWIAYDTDGAIIEFGKEPNSQVLTRLRLPQPQFRHLACEMVASYGMAVGKEVFETVLWIGRFIEAWGGQPHGGQHTLIYRKDVKINLCGSMRAKDANIRQALIDRFGPQGTKKNPGATYGISKDVWSALAVAVTYADAIGR
jgi:hypothetical protein